ncbi:DNA-3-methyladenine glycosylase [Rickettsiales bacterium LUAb2]
MQKLTKSFYTRNVDEVAKDLIGKEIHFNNQQGIIIEVESYCEEDPASHSYLGKKTKRNATMFDEAGTVYVYLIYGMYYCLNFVTGLKDKAEAVLIRGVVNSSNTNIDNNSFYNGVIDKRLIISGPGRVCKYFGITKEQNQQNIISNNNFYVVDRQIKLPFTATTRIGINKGQNLLRRYVVDFKNNKTY